MNEFELTLIEEDFEEISGRDASGLLVLGEEKETSQKPPSAIIQEIAPRVISRKLKKLVPQDYQLTQVRMDVKVKGAIFGQEVSGTVQVTFSPKEK